MNKKATLLAAAVAAFSVATSSAQAASIGDLCFAETDPHYDVEFYTSSSMKTVRYNPGTSALWVRITGFGANNTYVAHANGGPDGYIWRAFVKQYTCH